MSTFNTRCISLAELALHKSEDSAWLAIDGLVVDFTTFKDMHPGGGPVMMRYAGTDATEAFKQQMHSQAASNMLSNYQIGVLEGSALAAKLHSPSVATAPEWMSDNHQKRLLAMVDMKKPAVPQVLQMHKEYQDWVHHTQSVATGFRLFTMNFFESFSMYPWWYIFVLWLPVVSWHLGVGVMNGVPLLAVPFLMFVGFVIWTFMEYCIHRWIFHMYTETPWWNWFHFFAHGIHHLTPMDPQRLAFPPPFAVVIAFLFNRAVYMIGFQFLHIVFAGGALSFMLYDCMHFFFHHDRIGIISGRYAPRYFHWMKTRHMDHHFKNENRFYGVTNPFWDMVFGTS